MGSHSLVLERLQCSLLSQFMEVSFIHRLSQRLLEHSVLDRCHCPNPVMSVTWNLELCTTERGTDVTKHRILSIMMLAYLWADAITRALCIGTGGPESGGNSNKRYRVRTTWLELQKAGDSGMTRRGFQTLLWVLEKQCLATTLRPQLYMGPYSGHRTGLCGSKTQRCGHMLPQRVWSEHSCLLRLLQSQGLFGVLGSAAAKEMQRTRDWLHLCKDLYYSAGDLCWPGSFTIFPICQTARSRWQPCIQGHDVGPVPLSVSSHSVGDILQQTPS